MADVYLNGEFLPVEQARISVMDRGFLFGDGVYEVIPAYGNRLFRLPEHLDRLGRSLAAIRLIDPLSAAEWQTLLQRLIDQRLGEDQGVYLQVTRGPAPKRDHAIPAEVRPTIFAMANPIPPPDPTLAAGGAHAITLTDTRWIRCDIKAITLLANVLLRQEAMDHDAIEAILIRDGLATEGAASNLFVVHGGVLRTPPKGPLLLPGITRDLIVELAAAHSIDCREEPVSAEQLRSADEIWMTSSTKEIVPITRLDEQVVGGGVPGPLWRRMTALYQDYKARLRTES